MELQELIDLFNKVLNREGEEPVGADTNFKECKYWGSLSAFTISEEIFAKTGIALRGIQIRKCTTVMDLYDLISAK